MGCDIHLHVEIKRISSDSDEQWHHVSFRGEFSSRIYGMFAALANVRNSYGIVPLEIRGLPEDISWGTFTELYKRVKPEISESEEEYYYKIDQVEKWVNNGYSLVCEKAGAIWCSDPDAHSFNWCTPKEMKDAFYKVFINESGNYTGSYAEWLGLAGYMLALEATKEYECRAVYWFDN